MTYNDDIIKGLKGQEEVFEYLTEEFSDSILYRPGIQVLQTFSDLTNSNNLITDIKRDNESNPYLQFLEITSSKYLDDGEILESFYKTERQRGRDRIMRGMVGIVHLNVINDIHDSLVFNYSVIGSVFRETDGRSEFSKDFDNLEEKLRAYKSEVSRHK